MDATDDGGYILGVVKDIQGISGTRDDIWIIKTDDKGNTKWKFQIEEDGIQAAWTVQCTSDGGFIACGRTGNYGSSSSDGFVYKISSFENQRPDKPATPTGPSDGKTNIEYTFSTSSSDPDGGEVLFKWDWGDGNFSDWLDTNVATYTWTTEDNFEIRVMAMDEHGGESDWSDPFEFSTPKNKPYINTPFLNFLENYPHLFPLLRQLLDL